MSRRPDAPVALEEREDAVVITASPAHAPTVTLYVTASPVGRRGREGWRVTRDLDSPQRIVSEHSGYPAAVRSALSRARRYAVAYSTPRNLQGVPR